jgi:hypothetical protein
MTTEKEQRRHNSTYPKGGVSCFADTFGQAENSVLRMKFSGKNPALRVAANRCGAFEQKSRLTKNTRNEQKILRLNNVFIYFNFIF